ncbi:MAG: TAXI family TRAP transporter solute-binding subunit [Hyphomicrobiaceae bacterium]|nr:TAXI family TRAP transporter solute-binding subunit [Hyphomicrobiaceae bacterium]
MEVPYVFGSIPRARPVLGFALSVAILQAPLQAPMSTAGNSQESIKLRLGTATPGGGFPIYGAAFIGAIQGADPGLAIEPVNTKGSTENVPLLTAGSLDIALVQGEVVHETLKGGGGPSADLKIITAMYSTPGMFVVRADSPYRSIADLKGKPVAFGAAGSGLVILARYVLDGLGLDQKKDFQAIYLERAGDGPAMVLDGRAAALWGGGAGWPGFLAVARGEAGARFIVPNQSEIARILAKHEFLKPLTLPAGSFPGQDHPLKSVGSWSFVMSRPDLDEPVAYRLAKALHAGEAAIAASLPQAAETTARNTASAVVDPAQLHAGVRRYLSEIGLLK